MCNMLWANRLCVSAISSGSDLQCSSITINQSKSNQNARLVRSFDDDVSCQKIHIKHNHALWTGSHLMIFTLLPSRRMCSTNLTKDFQNGVCLVARLSTSFFIRLCSDRKQSKRSWKLNRCAAGGHNTNTHLHTYNYTMSPRVHKSFKRVHIYYFFSDEMWQSFACLSVPVGRTFQSTQLHCCQVFRNKK